MCLLVVPATCCPSAVQLKPWRHRHRHQEQPVDQVNLCGTGASFATFTCVFGYSESYVSAFQLVRAITHPKLIGWPPNGDRAASECRDSRHRPLPTWQPCPPWVDMSDTLRACCPCGALWCRRCCSRSKIRGRSTLDIGKGRMS